MRVGLPIVLLFAAMASSLAGENQIYWGEPIEGFELGIGFDAGSFESGAPIEVVVVTRNVGDSVRYLMKNWRCEQCDFSFHVVRDRNERVEAYTFGPQFGGFAKTEIPPGAMITNRIKLNSLHDLTRPGTYFVMASRMVPPVSEAKNQSAFGTTRLESGNAMIRVVELTNANAAGATNSVRNSSPAAQTVRPVQNSTTDNTSATKQTPVRDNSPAMESSPANSKPKDAVVSSSVAIASPVTEAKPFTPAQKVGTGIIAALVALLFAILWRASRRKPPG